MVSNWVGGIVFCTVSDRRDTDCEIAISAREGLSGLPLRLKAGLVAPKALRSDSLGFITDTNLFVAHRCEAR